MFLYKLSSSLKSIQTTSKTLLANEISLTVANSAILAYQIYHTFNVFAEIKSATNVLHDKTLFDQIENKLKEINETLIYIEIALDLNETVLLDEILLPNARFIIYDANQLISDIKC